MLDESISLDTPPAEAEDPPLEGCWAFTKLGESTKEQVLTACTEKGIKRWEQCVCGMLVLHPSLPHGKPLLQHLELMRWALQGSRARGLFLMPTPSAFATARDFSRVAIRAGL